MELPYRGSGKVVFGQKEYLCDLYYNEEEGGILLKINVKHEKSLGNFLEVPFEIPYLCGQLESGFKFTLLNLTRTGMQDLISYGISEYTFFAEYILCGIGGLIQQEQTFYKVSYVLSNIVEWGEESIYAIGEKYELFSRNENTQKTIYEGSDFSITYSVFGSFLPVVPHELLKEHIDLEQHGVFEIEFKKEEKFNQFTQVFERLKRLIEIAILSKVNIEKVEGYSKDVVYDLGETKHERAIEVYGKNIEQNNPMVHIERRHHWRWISLSELIKQNSFQCYFGKHEKLAPIIELFLEPLYVEGSSPTRTFLNIVQALETYHSRFVTNSLDEFITRIENMVNGQSPENAEKHRAYLMANSKRFITLESRLADLLVANRQIFFDTGEINHANFPSVIAHTRNYYIHYDERIKEKYRILSEGELPIYNRLLLQILEYYILLELGFSNDRCELKEKLIERWGNISQDLSILNASKSLHNS